MELSIRVAAVYSQSENSLQKRVQKLFDEIGESCPFLLAKHLGVKINYVNDMGDIDGIYITTVPDTQRVFLNGDINHENQEEACFRLMLHHLEHPGVSDQVMRGAK